MKLRLVFVCFFIICSVQCFANKEYINLLGAAVNELRQGETAKCIDLLRQAAEYETKDPLAKTALGVACLLGDKQALASKYFQQAFLLDKSYPLAHYGIAVIELSKLKPNEAIPAFAKAQSYMPSVSLAAEIEYLKTLSVIGYTGSDISSDNDLMRSIKAVWFMRQSKKQQALDEIKAVFENPIRDQKENPIGVLATFNPKASVIFNGQKLADKLDLDFKPKRNISVVKDDLVVKADSKQAPSVKVVAFKIDEKLIGITNVSPYVCSLDTKLYPDGVHKITIEGTTEDNYAISKKTIYINIKNHPLSQDQEYKLIYQDLYELLRLKPSTDFLNKAIKEINS